MDCDPNVPEVFAAPPRVLDLSVGPNPVSGLNEVRWQSLGPVSGADTRYDVVTGTLGSLRQTGGFSGAACALANVPSPGGPDPAPNPAPGPRGDLDQSSPCPN